MKVISEVWGADRELPPNPDVTHEGREAFWEELARHHPKDAVPGLRRLVEFFTAVRTSVAAVRRAAPVAGRVRRPA